MDRLDGSHNRGYTNALLDVLHWIEAHEQQLKTERMFSSKGITLLLKTFIENREQFREMGEYTPFVLSKDKKSMWLYEEGK